MPIAVETLLPSRQLVFDLYVRQPNETGCVLYREKNIPLEPDDLKRLVERDVHTLFIHFQDREGYADYLRSALIGNNAIEPMQRYRLLQAATQSVFQDAFSGGRVDKLLTGRARDLRSDRALPVHRADGVTPALLADGARLLHVHAR